MLLQAVPAKTRGVVQCYFNVKPESTTLTQHLTNHCSRLVFAGCSRPVMACDHRLLPMVVHHGGLSTLALC